MPRSHMMLTPQHGAAVCGFVDVIFTNRTALRAAQAVYTNVTICIRKRHENKMREETARC
jgi:hypothetical protein